MHVYIKAYALLGNEIIVQNRGKNKHGTARKSAYVLFYCISIIIRMSPIRAHPHQLSS